MQWLRQMCFMELWPPEPLNSCRAACGSNLLKNDHEPGSKRYDLSNPPVHHSASCCSIPPGPSYLTPHKSRNQDLPAAANVPTPN